MTTSDNLEFPLLSESQAQKSTMTNEALAAIEAAVSSTLVLDTSDATTAGDDVIMPFDDANDLSTRDALRCIYLDIQDQATAVFNVIHPPNFHLFYCKNNSSYAATIKCEGQTGITLGSGASAILYCDGTDIISISDDFLVDSIKVNYDLEAAVFNRPESGQVIAKFLIARTTSIAADFANSVGNVGTNPASVATLTVKNNGTTIGNISISTGGVVTFSTTSGTAKVLNVGDIVTIENQSVADVDLADVMIVLRGTTYDR